MITVAIATKRYNTDSTHHYTQTLEFTDLSAWETYYNEILDDVTNNINSDLAEWYDNGTAYWVQHEDEEVSLSCEAQVILDLTDMPACTTYVRVSSNSSNVEEYELLDSDWATHVDLLATQLTGGADFTLSGNTESPYYENRLEIDWVDLDSEKECWAEIWL